jgi:hypothetical protein
MRVLLVLDATPLDSKLAHMGTRLTLTERPSRCFRSAGWISLDIHTDRQGEFFEIAWPAAAAVEVLDLQPN